VMTVCCATCRIHRVCQHRRPRASFTWNHNDNA